MEWEKNTTTVLGSVLYAYSANRANVP